MNAVDTNVLVYAVDETEPDKQSRAIGLLDELSKRPVPLAVPWQVAVEFIACLRRWQALGRIDAKDVVAYKVHFLDPMPIVMPSVGSLQVSLELSDRYSLSHWDSLLVAACREAGIKVLYSEDLDAGASYDGLTVVNPFA